MLGKEKCKILKEIRQRIADENDIPWVTQECRHQGSCRGTCPKCESELRELERQLAARQSLGKRVAVAALCAGMAFSSVGCTTTTQRTPKAHEPKIEDVAGIPMLMTPEPTETPDIEGYVLEGEVPYDGPEDGESELMGDVAYIEPEETEDFELAGEPMAEDEVNG